MRDRIRARMAAKFEKQIAQDQVSGGKTLAYGKDAMQTLSYWGAATKSAKPTPLIVFVHGGGWKRGTKENGTGKAKLAHFTGEGYAFASIDYRLVPEATVEQQAADVASALAHLIAHAGDLGFDPRRIILMGHSAGAHLVALVGTDPAYLKAVGLTETSIAGVVPIAFGTDPARQRAISPTLQAAAPNAPAFLILHVQRKDGIEQANALADALRKAGTPVQINDFPGTGLQGHMEINRKLGLEDYPATAVVDAWLKGRFGG